MTTYLLLVSIVLIFFSVLIALSFYKNFQKQGENLNVNRRPPGLTYQEKIISLDWKARCLIGFALILILFALYAPFILTREAPTAEFDFSHTGEIGDTIGGLMNPFITLSGVIITGLAFYMQYQANQLQRELFQIAQNDTKQQFKQQLDTQKFESQFYEMLNLHRANITEMKISGYDFEENLKKRIDKTTEGRKVFVTMKTEFECIISLYCEDRALSKTGFERCYWLFFFGIDQFEKKYPNENLLINKLKEATKQHKYPDNQIINNEARKSFSTTKLKFNYKPFSGHASRLGHYFRHLYMAVKFVVNSDVVANYDDKMKYLRILRAQLSNHEQILLFYNWLGDFGTDWENKENRFFTEYCMIHNLWHNNLYEGQFIENAIAGLRNKEVKYRTGDLFEID
jgi:hypothetical protein